MHYLLVLTVFLFMGNAAGKLSKGAEIVETKEGNLKGTTLKSRNSRNYFTFQGIQYAKVNGRFEPPSPPETWSGIKDAVDFGPECPQTEYFVGKGKIIVNSEDCLYLNVYVPELEEYNDDLPVMVWIHGGGFFEGAGSHFGADYFMDEDVILVTINYRLGVLGFLNTGDGVVPGNNGLRDMIMALKWIQRNIQEFNGDSKRVTIFGESAGAWAVHYLMLSPATKDLFHGAICQSGTVLSPIGFVSDPKDSNERLAERLSCPSEPTTALVNCLKDKKLENILEAQKNLSFLGPAHLKVPFGPSVDSGAGKEADLIIPTAPFDLITTTEVDIPFIIGLTESEGLLGFAGVYLVTQKLMDDLNDNWLKISAETFGYKQFVPENELENFGSELRQIYMGSQNFSLDTEESFVDMHSHYIMYRAAKLTAELTAQRSSNVYPYVFTHRGGFSLANYLGLYGRGPAHCDELQYQFRSLKRVKSWPDLIHDWDIDFSKKFVKLWVSFAKYGKPTATWSLEWEPANVVGQALGSEFPWYSIHQRPNKSYKFSKDSERKFVQMDELYSKYEKPKRSWRAHKQELKEEL